MPGTTPNFRFPETELAQAAQQFAESLEQPVLLNHSVRSYLFAQALADRQGLASGADFDDELLFLCCVLHEVGLTDEGNGDQRFEVDGADLAVRFLTERGLSAESAEIVWDAIALHTSAGIANRKRAEIALTHAGIGADLWGREADTLPPGVGHRINEAFPRARYLHGGRRSDSHAGQGQARQGHRLHPAGRTRSPARSRSIPARLAHGGGPQRLGFVTPDHRTTQRQSLSASRGNGFPWLRGIRPHLGPVPARGPALGLGGDVGPSAIC